MCCFIVHHAVFSLVALMPCDLSFFIKKNFSATKKKTRERQKKENTNNDV